MEEKEQFLQGLDLFKGYNFAYLVNILMNIKKKIYNFDEIIYDEEQETKNLYFIKSGEVELSKKVVIKEDGTSQQKSKECKKKDRVVMAQKQPNEWFGEVEIMQNIKRYTRARCVSTKLEVYYISALKFFANLSIEEMVSDMKKSSSMIDKWRQKHYESMMNRLYNSKRDPLRKTFENMQVAHDLINEKFKSDFMRVRPEQIVNHSKAEETSLAAKIVYYNTVKQYVSKISDVVGTISKMKQNKEHIQKEEIIKNTNEMQKRQEQLEQLRSKSLPRQIYHPKSHTNIMSASQNAPLTLKKNISQQSSEMNSPLKLPYIHLNENHDELGHRQSINTTQNSIVINKSQLNISMSERLPSINDRQYKLQLYQQQQQQQLPEYQMGTPLETERGKKVKSQFNTPSNKKIKLNINKKLQFLNSQNELEEQFTQRNSLSHLYPLTTPHTSCTLNHIPIPKPLVTERVKTDLEIMENIYDGIVHNKHKNQEIIFNKDINKKILDDGMRKKNLQMHQSKHHEEDFTNLLTRLATTVGLPNEDLDQDQAKKLKLFRKLKLDNILDYKYLNQKKIERAKKSQSLQIDQGQKQSEKLKSLADLHSPKQHYKFVGNQAPLLPKTFSTNIIPKSKLVSSAVSSITSMYTPISRSELNKKLNKFSLIHNNPYK